MKTGADVLGLTARAPHDDGVTRSTAGSPPARLLRPCLDCGLLTSTTRCTSCQPSEPDRPSRGSARERGYDTAWDRLSRRARRLQPFCTDCGATEGLTTDHLPTAWERIAARLPLRLVDVEVVCQSCNNVRGSSRPGSRRAARVETTGAPPTPTLAGPPVESKFASHTTPTTSGGR